MASGSHHGAWELPVLQCLGTGMRRGLEHLVGERMVRLEVILSAASPIPTTKSYRAAA